MNDWLSDAFRDRPFWLNALLVFSAFMTFVYMPWDIFVKPVAQDQEVWFGIMFTGWGAKVAAFPHWFVYGAAVYGIRHRRPWMPFWGAAYAAQIALGMFVWNLVQIGWLTGLFVGLIGAAPFGLLAAALWNATGHFPSTPRSLRERYGDWALVTGASAGIGAEFARALARQGLSCVLTARREDRLSDLAAELEKECSVATRTVAVDLASADGPQQVIDAVKDLEIGVLVNNAGVGYAGRFDLLEGDRLREQISLNCIAPVMVTHALLPGMRERGRGAVIVTGSVAGRQPLPLHGIYSATKAFDHFFGESLWAEQRDAGIDVLVLEPGSTRTEFQEVAGELGHDGGEPPADVVGVALDALGRQPSVISGWFNYLRSNVATRVGSRPLVLRIAQDMMRRQTPPELL